MIFWSIKLLVVIRLQKVTESFVKYLTRQRCVRTARKRSETGMNCDKMRMKPQKAAMMYES